MEKKIKPTEIISLESVTATENLGPVVVGDRLSSLSVLTLFINNKVRHIIQKSNINSDAEIAVADTMVTKPRSFIDFPLSAILGIEKADAHSEKAAAELQFYISDPSEKLSVLEEIENYSAQLASPKSASQDVRLVADELITNAIYNAPFVDESNSTSGAPRDSKQVKISEDKRPYVFLGKDATRIIVGCKDFHGSLNVNKLIERIQRCYIRNPGELINFGPGGAGIGSYMIFDSCISMYLAVDPGKSTTVMCSFPRQMSARKRNEVPKNLHVYC